MAKIDLDFVLDDAHTSDGAPTTRAAILKQITDHGLEYTILLENGPAGGNPLLELRGTHEQIEKYMREVYLAHDLSEIDWYLTFIK